MRQRVLGGGSGLQAESGEAGGHVDVGGFEGAELTYWPAQPSHRSLNSKLQADKATD